jgi:hypothetical protein
VQVHLDLTATSGTLGMLCDADYWFSHAAVCLCTQVCTSLNAKYGTDIKGNDVPCDNLIYCKKCGGVDAVAKACGAVAKCAAFVMEDSTNCGYLK